MKSILETNPNYGFLARLDWPDGSCMEVPCKLFLPDRVGGDLRLAYTVNYANFERLIRTPPCRLSAEVRDADLKIVANDVRIGSGSASAGWGLNEGYLLACPRDLRLTRKLRDDSSGMRGVFRLTNSLQLEPFDIHSLHPDGSIEWKRGERVRFDLDNVVRLTFDHEYRECTSLDHGEIRIRSGLVATADTQYPLPTKGLDECFPQLDDFLLLISLAEGRRCVCPEATWTTGGESTTIYRLDRVVPSKLAHHSPNDFLIRRDNLQSFLAVSYQSLRTHSQQTLMRTALTAATFSDSASIEENFLSLFSALESVVLAFRRSNELEFVIAEEQWEIIRDGIKEFLKSHQLLKEDSVRRGRLYKNLAGLNRVSLATAVTEMAATHNVELKDGWPLFEAAQGCSLAEIRNMLVHGEHFSDVEWQFVSDAKSCLQTIMQRFLLSMLGWDYRMSRAKNLDATSRDWSESRSALSRVRQTLRR